MFVNDDRYGIEADFITRAMNPATHSLSGRGTGGVDYRQFTGASQPAKGSGLDSFIQDISEAHKNLTDRVDALESDLKSSKEMEGLSGFWKKNQERVKNTALIAIGLYFAYSLFLKSKMARGGSTPQPAPAKIGTDDI